MDHVQIKLLLNCQSNTAAFMKPSRFSQTLQQNQFLNQSAAIDGACCCRIELIRTLGLKSCSESWRYQRAVGVTIFSQLYVPDLR